MDGTCNCCLSFFKPPQNNLLERGDTWVHVLKVWRSRGGEDLGYFQNISPMLSALQWKKSRVHCLVLIISTRVVLLLYCQLCPHLYMLSVRTKTFSPGTCSLQCGQGKECTQLQCWSTWWGFLGFFFGLGFSFSSWSPNSFEQIRYTCFSFCQIQRESRCLAGVLFCLLVSHSSTWLLFVPPLAAKHNAPCYSELTFLSRGSAQQKHKYTKPNTGLSKDFEGCPKRKDGMYHIAQSIGPLLFYICLVFNSSYAVFSIIFFFSSSFLLLLKMLLKRQWLLNQ